jgi:putative transposase
MPIRTIPLLVGVVYHVTNRAREGLVLFDSPTAYLAFTDLIVETQTQHPIRILAFCVMANHWHFLLWPERVGAIQRFIGTLALTHAVRLNKRRGTSGAVYPKRFEARPVQSGASLVQVARYIERNPCAAGLVGTPSAYPWSSAAADGSPVPLSDWPTPRPRDWKRFVAQPIESAELMRIREHLKRGPQRRLRGGRGFEW